MVGSSSAYEKQSIKRGDSLEVGIHYVADSAHSLQLPTCKLSCKLSWDTGAHTGPSLSNGITITIIIIIIISQLCFHRFCLLAVVLQLSMFREGCAPQVAFSSPISFSACAVCLVGDEVRGVHHGKRPACSHEVCN